MEIAPGVHAIERLGVGRAYLYEEADRRGELDNADRGTVSSPFAQTHHKGFLLLDECALKAHNANHQQMTNQSHEGLTAKPKEAKDELRSDTLG